MNPFPLFAALTVGVSFTVLGASLETPGDEPFALDPAVPRPARATAFDGGAGSFAGVDEGPLDHELLSADPVNAWLARYLTPASR